MTGVATLLVGAAGVYAFAGLLFALPFAIRGVGVVDPGAAGSPVGFRLLILPASAAFWPWLAWRWIRKQGPRREHNAHRDRARANGGEP